MQILQLITALLQLALLWRVERYLCGKRSQDTVPEPAAEPDREKSRKAAEAIDRFNAGVANILGYDAGEEGSA